MVRGQFVSKPLVHFMPDALVTACGLKAYTRRYDGGYPSITEAWDDATCWSCKRTIAWKKARG